jgi:hypothetical protein
LADSPFPGSLKSSRQHSRAGSLGARLVTALTSDRHFINNSMRESKSSIFADDRVWYDQFTSTDWVHDSIADAYRVKALRSRKDLRGRIKAFFDGTQGWILSALVGFITATIAYTVDVSEAPVFDWKDGYCSEGFFLSEKVCGCRSITWQSLVLKHILFLWCCCTAVLLGFGRIQKFYSINTQCYYPMTVRCSKNTHHIKQICFTPQLRPILIIY